MWQALQEFFESTGLYYFFQDDGWKNLVMILISLTLIYLAVFKKFEPYLLIPIGFAMLLVNIPNTGMFVETISIVDGEEVASYSGLLGFLYYGVKLGIYPPLIFLGIGATTDFGPLIANPKSMLLGAAAQVGIFLTFIGAIILGFSGPESASIGIIGGADGPTSILLASRLAPHLIGAISLAAYSYMALVPMIQPPIINLLTTKKERAIKMEQLREVKQTEKVIFPIIVSVVCMTFIPSSAPIIGMLMLGNLIKESNVVPNLTKTAGESLLYIITILLGLSIGATTMGSSFLRLETLMIIALGLFAFSVATASGVLGGKVMCKLTHGKVNPMIGAAGVSAVPMAARVVHIEGQKNDPNNYLLMHAMGPNVAGVIGSAIAAGLFLMFFM
ncbi:sodium ion-translocating decarboxylase subunit beta [Peloplasma aerotolerans]|uniref:Sodium ion-translocating decarboxylase subunit beta n=1 Tax=Peloplasma aerotolerans TaxID=3044389 RepID=A0AAW6U533_9MOLU|nr:sodium ion-translocating decarboxylase subunit beta [Mariniplasma sp. M4Ah]MDI6453081.1 sodium ion-translocating decarboxylase subunit beta [Mariniplasma sp. M4Ah]MDR4968458.1 sodium ion-translocating decarboxylase subunit beta [Acholeplasmataceae bacterium]